MRINKYLAQANLGSRRKCEQFVLDGKVSVNGKITKNLSTDIDENEDVVICNGIKINKLTSFYYIVLHKPKGYITTVTDERGRKTVMELVPERYKGVFPVGRLDYDTEGLLLLTNDGDFAYKLTHPSSMVPKTYTAKIEGKITADELNKLKEGVVVDGSKTSKANIINKGFENGITKIEITITEGKNRQIRKMLESVGKNIVFLKRISIGDVRLGGLTRGTTRELKEKEINRLKAW